MFKFPYMCRLCLIPSQMNTFIQIFDGTSEIPFKISELTNIKVESGDGLPQEMCVLCHAQLDLSVTFKRQVEKADLMLRHHLAQKTLQLEDDTPETLITGDLLLETSLRVNMTEKCKVKDEGGNTRDSETTNWEDVPVKVEAEDDMAVAEPWPESVPEENVTRDIVKKASKEPFQAKSEVATSSFVEQPDEKQSLETIIGDQSDDKKLLENSLKGIHTDGSHAVELTINKFKEENEVETLNMDVKNVLSEDEHNETNVKLKFTHKITCKRQSCSKKKKIKLWDSDDSSDECDLDLEKFKNKSRLRRRHQKYKSGNSGELYKCEHCTKTFQSHKGLQAHQRQHASKAEPPTQTTVERSENIRRSSRPSKAPVRHVIPHYSCSKCERMYNDQATLENHEKSHIIGKPGMKCNHCGKKFFNKEYLEAHIQSSHIFKTKSRNRGHPCNICGQTYESRSDMFAHMRSHKSPVQLCEVCGKTVSLNAYPAHKRSHVNVTSQQVFHCDLCEKTFNNKVSLRTHKNSYHGTPKYTCEVCGKQFTTMALMRHHQHVHSGKRDHVCQVCGRGFTLKITLKSHMRIHTGETPYKCDKCGRQFTWKTTYRNHVSSCKGIKSCSENKPLIAPQLFSLALNVPQELPIDYSEEAKYEVPVNYSEEAKYKHFLNTDTKNIPLVLKLSDEMKYVPQQPVNYTGDFKPLSRDINSSV